MAEVVNRRLNIFIDQAGAESALEKLTKKENDLVAAIERGKKAGKDLTREMNELAATRGKIGQLNDVISGKVLPSINQAEAAVKKLRRELNSMSADSVDAGKKLADLKKAEATLAAVQKQAYGVGNALKEIGNSQGFLGKLQSGIGNFLSTLGPFILAGGAVGVLSTVKDFLSDSVNEALKADEASARLKGTLDNLGKADVFNRLSKSAKDFASAIGYLDNDDILGVFEKLIDYGKLTEKQINELTPVIIDFAAKQRIELPEATDVIVKALEGNSKGLKTYGINMADAKDETEAFIAIMDQLKPKVEGAAVRSLESTSGQIKKTTQDIANLKEEIGTGLLPVVKDVFSAISGIVAKYNALSNATFWEKIKISFGLFKKGSSSTLDELVARQKTQANTPDAPSYGAWGNLMQDGGVLGTGQSGLTDAQKKAIEDAKRLREEAAKKAAKDIEDLQKKYKEFSVRTEEATEPILAAFRKINEAAKDDIGTVKEALDKGLITREQADQAFKNIERVLDDQRLELQKKFNLNPIIIPVDIKPTDIEGTTNADAKGAGKDIFAKLFNGITKQVADANQTASDKEKRKKELDELAQQITDWSFQVSDIYLNLSAARSNAEQAAFEKEVANNNKRKDSAQKLLDQKLISQKEYERRVAKIDKEQEAHRVELQKRQFKRDQNAQTVMALMNAAQAIVATLAARPGTLDIISLGAFRAISIGLIAATTASQIAAIRSAKPPQFADGGFIPDGSSHRQGGISLRDNRTGAVVGEVEGGEPIISKKTYAANKSLIDNLLGSRGTLSPQWMNGSVSSMNVPRINSSMGYFENGGFIPGKSASDTSAQMMALLQNLNQQLSSPLIANVIYGQYEAKASAIDAIRKAGMVN